MLRYVYLLSLLLVHFLSIGQNVNYGTRSAEITYRPVPGVGENYYEITLTIYDYVSNFGGNGFISQYINFGDSTYVLAYRCNGPSNSSGHLGEIVAPNVRKNIYVAIHKYKGNGTYLISSIAVCRKNGGVNYPVGIPYCCLSIYVSATLTINNPSKPISSPIFTIMPLNDNCLNSKFTINPGAVDPDGDEMKFYLQTCQEAICHLNGYLNTYELKVFFPDCMDIPNYIYPQDLDPTKRTIFTIDSKTGVITWDKPMLSGTYIIALRAEKWRNNVMIGSVMRDFQVNIFPCTYNPPVIKPVPDRCIVAGKTLTYDVTSSDIDNDTLTFTTTGLPYDLATNPATFTLHGTNVGSTSGTFNWNTSIQNYQKNPYKVYYKVSDIHNGFSLSDVKSSLITVIAPPVKNVNATIQGRGFNVKWDPSVMALTTGYNIYRKTGISPTVLDTCAIGVSANSAYKLVGTVNDPTTVSFTDNNNGNGLTSGYYYCYIITTVLADGNESAPSEPVCSPLMIPFIKVLKDTLTSCQWNTLTLDPTIIRFENADVNTTYEWSSTNDLQILHPNSAYTDLKLIKSGMHSVKITALSGIYTDSARIYINVLPVPDPVIKLKDLGGMPDSVMYYNKSTNATFAEWTFADGTHSSVFDSVMFVYNKDGYFRTFLKVYNLLACPDTTSILFRVVLKGVAIPNAFEPENPNGLLNRFKPNAIGLKSYFLGIWDLWGNLIWSTDKLQDKQPIEGWDGTDRFGNKMPSQNYIWRMNATFIDGSVWKGIQDRFGKYHKEGTFSLLR